MKIRPRKADKRRPTQLEFGFPRDPLVYWRIPYRVADNTGRSR